ncbi:MAG TPA: bifunctional aspartate kinase/homoserine dehydrogenase I [Phnomibacter sp.]|nr:bifunctional aspartate kinase/homoserine dehydrogenase I [Phnomibacter sp.]
MHVLKFGGSSVANSTNIKLISDIFLSHQASKKIVVVSALGGITDQLIACAQLAEAGDEKFLEVVQAIEKRHLDTIRELLPVNNQSGCLSALKQLCNDLEAVCEGVFRLRELSNRSKDRIVSFGELFSSKIISGYLSAIGVQHEWLDSRNCIKTDSHFGNASVNFADTNLAIQQAISQSKHNLFLAPGFIASDAKGLTTTLGRGGSDYSAAIYAAALHAESLEIWTDVSGMMTADPRWVSNAKPLPTISYQEAMELSHFGAKVIYPPTLQPAMQLKIPVWIKNSFAAADHGTLIQHESSQKNGVIKGISSISNISLLSLEGGGMIGIPGFSKRLFQALANEKVNVILITQGSSEHSICVGIHSADVSRAAKAVNHAFEIEIANGKVEPIAIEEELSIIALVGDQMKSHTGVSGQMFSALGRNGINVRAIAQGSSERNISAVIAARDVKKAVNVLHEAFFEEVKKQLNLYVVGVGNVGKRLLDQIHQQQQYLSEQLRMQVRIVGIANSKKMYFDEKGVDISNWHALLENGDSQTPASLVETIVAKNLRNSVFVDITASSIVAEMYESLLRKSVAVVACNKVAASSVYANYKKLKSLAREYNTSFLFETNVGAGLPVIGTLNDLVKSGDIVHRIEAVLSGTLNFVFNNYDGSSSFEKVVRQAQAEGYTEPDPRLDLGGTDVMRKILILAREAGYQMEMEDIANQSFLPASCMEGDVENFYSELAKHEAHFSKLLEEANAAGCKLKFVATFNEGKASVGLKHISPEQDFYHLYGKDNIVLFYTQRYPEQPLVIKGAGAGADVTASGVFADIIRVIN